MRCRETPYPHDAEAVYVMLHEGFSLYNMTYGGYKNYRVKVITNFTVNIAGCLVQAPFAATKMENIMRYFVLFRAIILVLLLACVCCPFFALAATPSNDAALEKQAQQAFEQQLYPQAKALYEQLAAQRQKQFGPTHAKTLIARRGIATSVRGQGKHKQAMSMLTALMEEQKKILGPEHRDTLKTLATVGETFHYIGQYEKEVSLLQDALARQKRVLGETDEDTLETALHMAGGIFALGDSAKALKMWEDSLAPMRKSLGQNHKLTLAAQVNIAMGTAVSGNPQKAISLYQGLMPKVKQLLGDENVVTLAGYEGLAGAYARAGNTRKAQEIILMVYSYKKNLLGENHPETLKMRTSVAVGIAQQGKLQEARDAWKDILSRQKQLLGETHEDTLNTSACLATVLIQLGDYTQARSLAQGAADAAIREFGQEHLLTLYALETLASVLTSQGDQHGAYTILSRTLSVRERIQGPQNTRTQFTRLMLSQVERALGKNGKGGRSTSEKILADYEKTQGPDHPDTLNARFNHAQTLAGEGKFKEAATMLASVYRAQKKSLGSAHPTTLNTGNFLAGYYLANTNLAESEKVLHEILPQLEDKMGKNDRVTLSARANLVALLMIKGDYKTALQHQTALLEGRKQLLGVEHPSTLDSMLALGLMYTRLGHLDRARDVLSQAEGLCVRTLGKTNGTTLNVRGCLADVYSKLGDSDKALAMFGEVVPLLQKTLGQDHLETLATQMMQASAFVDAGNPKEAQKIFTDVLRKGRRALGETHPQVQLAQKLLSDMQMLSKVADSKSNQAKVNAVAEYSQNTSAATTKTLSEYALTVGRENQLFTMLLNELAAKAHFAKIPDAGIFYSKLAILAAQTQRTLNVGLERELQQTYQAKTENTYHIAILSLLRAGRNQEALAALSFLKIAELDDKSRETYDARQMEEDFLTSGERDLFRGFTIRVDNLYALGQEMQALQAREATLSAAEQKKLGEILVRAEKDTQAFHTFLENIQKELEKRKKKTDTTNTASANLRQLREILNRTYNNSVFVHTASMSDTTLIFVTAPTNMVVRTADVSQSTLNATIVDFYAALTNPTSDPRPEGKKLYDALIAPIAKDLVAAGAKTIMFSLDGALRYIPMSALYDGKQWLAEKYDITMFTEAARKSMQQSAASGNTIAAMGVTKALSGFSALPAVAGEIDGIVKGKGNTGVLPGTKHLDKQFTRNTLASILKKGVPLVHVASHFQFDPTDQKASFLLLGDGKKLTMGEMFGSKGLSFDKVDLLTLSACDTASGVKKGDGREVESFGAMAQRYGAKAVLASLWPVADASTAAFMQEFYALRGVDGMNKAASLAKTQRAMLQGEITPASAGNQRSQRGKVSVAAPGMESKPEQAVTHSASEWTHPYYWAPFILMGNWE